MKKKIPVLRPKLPDAQSLLPYLLRTDESRIYSNFGPLAVEFQSRLAMLLGVAPESVISASCGTNALIAAILGGAGVPTNSRPYAIIPSFTFVATAIAAERCGFQLYFVDVDPNSWTLDAFKMLEHPILDHAGVIIPVAPFGRPVLQQDWLAFRERSGVPVVIDAGASLSCIIDDSRSFIGSIPTAFSLHATKSFGIGEGGCVISTEGDVIARVSASLNFGFIETRDSAIPSLNGKLSEYHAAVGLALLSCWKEKWATVSRVVRCYRDEFGRHGLSERFFSLPQIDGSYALFLCGTGKEAGQIMSALERDCIDFRLWYGAGVHRHTHFLNAARDDHLPVTERLGCTLIGLPMAPDLQLADIARVAAVVSSNQY
jgi:dTDP-4-amino-4,6-dideoxygalactose transaminase